jgi:hypothetical protein
MFDIALVEQCADPSIEIAIVERFIAAAGSDNPLAISITSGNRVILPEAPQTKDEAMRLVQSFVGKAVVRVGLTQYPAGLGVIEVSALSPDLVDACGNIRVGSALFAKVYRIVALSDETPRNEVFAEAIEAWRTGLFQGTSVFAQADPGSVPDVETEAGADRTEGERAPATEVLDMLIEDAPPAEPPGGENPNTADIRVDLTGIGGEAPL